MTLKQAIATAGHTLKIRKSTWKNNHYLRYINAQMLFPYMYIVDNSKPWIMVNCMCEFKDKKVYFLSEKEADDGSAEWEVCS